MRERKGVVLWRGESSDAHPVFIQPFGTRARTHTHIHSHTCGPAIATAARPSQAADDRWAARNAYLLRSGRHLWYTNTQQRRRQDKGEMRACVRPAAPRLYLCVVASLSLARATAASASPRPLSLPQDLSRYLIARTFLPCYLSSPSPAFGWSVG